MKIISSSASSSSSSEKITLHPLVSSKGSEIAAAKVVMERLEATHAMDVREILITDCVKVGRSMGKLKPAHDNAIFECKVLSRNQAVIWFKDSKFYLKDTRSSNGTFLNSRKLPEDTATEIFSGDSVQFGVNIAENGVSLHSCVSVRVKLYIPSGMEFTKRLLDNCPKVQVSMIDMYQIHEFVQENAKREQVLKQKITRLESQMGDLANVVTRQCDDIIAKEDMVNRITKLETQLVYAKQNFGCDDLRKKILSLMDSSFDAEQDWRAKLKQCFDENANTQVRVCEYELDLKNAKSVIESLRSEVSNYEQLVEEYRRKQTQQTVSVKQDLEALPCNGSIKTDTISATTQTETDIEHQDNLIRNGANSREDSNDVRQSSTPTSVVTSNEQIIVECDLALDDNPFAAALSELDDELNLAEIDNGNHDSLSPNNNFILDTMVQGDRCFDMDHGDDDCLECNGCMHIAEGRCIEEKGFESDTSSSYSDDLGTIQSSYLTVRPTARFSVGRIFDKEHHDGVDERHDIVDAVAVGCADDDNRDLKNTSFLFRWSRQFYVFTLLNLIVIIVIALFSWYLGMQYATMGGHSQTSTCTSNLPA